MRIGRTLPPAAAPLPWNNILKASPSLFSNASGNGAILEEELKSYFDVKYCYLLSSGKAALAVILKALHTLYPDKDEVLIPAFTCYSVPASIKKVGLKIRICEMAPSSLDIDYNHLQEIVDTDRKEQKLLCFVATHLFGCPADLPRLHKIIGKTMVTIEDAAQSMGEATATGKLGTLTDIGFFSLGRGKALSLLEGGVIVTNRDDIGKTLREITQELPGYKRIDMAKLLAKAIVTNVLQHPQLYWLPKALPFLKLGETIYDEHISLRQISPFQRKLARGWQRNLEAMRKARTQNMLYWQNRLPEDIRLPCTLSPEGSLIRLPLLAQSNHQRNCIVESSNREGLGIMPGYPTPVHRIPQIADEFRNQDYPVAQNLCDRLFTLPIHQLVDARDNQKISKLLSEICRI